MPKAAIAMPVYKSAHWLQHVSLPTLLRQSIPDWTLYIVHDGEIRDNTEEVINHFQDSRIHFSSVPRIFPEPEGEKVPIHSTYWQICGVNCTNEALRLIKENHPECQYVFHLDPDDAWTPIHLERMMKVMDESPNTDFGYALTERWEYDKYRGHWGQPFDPSLLMRRNFIALSSIVLRMDAAKHGYYYSAEPGEVSDWRWLKAFYRASGKYFLQSNIVTAYHFCRCSVEHAKGVVSWTEKMPVVRMKL